MENKKLLPISIIALAMSIVFGSIWIGHSIEKLAAIHTPMSPSTSTEHIALTLTQVAEYLNMTEEEVQLIINWEETASVNEGKLPYVTINNKQYFHKDEIDEWLKEVTSSHRQFDNTRGWVLQ